MPAAKSAAAAVVDELAAEVVVCQGPLGRIRAALGIGPALCADLDALGAAVPLRELVALLRAPHPSLSLARCTANKICTRIVDGIEAGFAGAAGVPAEVAALKAAADLGARVAVARSLARQLRTVGESASGETESSLGGPV